MRLQHSAGDPLGVTTVVRREQTNPGHPPVVPSGQLPTPQPTLPEQTNATHLLDVLPSGQLQSLHTPEHINSGHSPDVPMMPPDQPLPPPDVTHSPDVLMLSSDAHPTTHPSHLPPQTHVPHPPTVEVVSTEALIQDMARLMQESLQPTLRDIMEKIQAIGS
jgi:hypothetical protein